MNNVPFKLATPEEFETWLDQLPEGITFTAASTCKCPLACYYKAVGYPDVRVANAWLYPHGEPGDGSGSLRLAGSVDADLWHRRFIDKIDHLNFISEHSIDDVRNVLATLRADGTIK